MDIRYLGGFIYHGDSMCHLSKDEVLADGACKTAALQRFDQDALGASKSSIALYSCLFVTLRCIHPSQTT